MREIKFRYRVQNRETKEILTAILTVQDIQDQAFVFKDYLTWEVLSRDEFTGLKDKTGVEIYEGDILKSTSNYINMATEKPTGKICIRYYQVLFIEEEARWGTKEKNGYIDKFKMVQEIISKYCEVIGNIYENPELLNTGQESIDRQGK